jgi:hypothetical protein
MTGPRIETRAGINALKLMDVCDGRLDSGLVRGWVKAPLDLGVYPPTHPRGGGVGGVAFCMTPPTHLGGSAIEGGSRFARPHPPTSEGGGQGSLHSPRGYYNIFDFCLGFKITIYAHKPPKIAVRVKNEHGEHCPRRLMPE